MAQRRWQMQRQREAELVAMDPIKLTGRIVRRIVVIDDERTVRECVFTDLDSRREASRKLRKVLCRS
jgi:alkyl hydroperoxide reductase subunit AhpC